MVRTINPNEFYNGVIDEQPEVQAAPAAPVFTSDHITYDRYAGVRDRVFTNPPTTAGNILMLCPVSLDGIASSGMAKDVRARYSDAWASYVAMCSPHKSNRLTQGTVLFASNYVKVKEIDPATGEETGKMITKIGKDGQPVLSRLIIGFMPVKGSAGDRKSPQHASLSFLKPALDRLAQLGNECAPDGSGSYLAYRGITEVRTSRLVVGDEGTENGWDAVGPEMLYCLAQLAPLPVTIHIGAELCEYHLDEQGDLHVKAAPADRYGANRIADVM